jgi:hypothetical protein
MPWHEVSAVSLRAEFVALANLVRVSAGSPGTAGSWEDKLGAARRQDQSRPAVDLAARADIADVHDAPIAVDREDDVAGRRLEHFCGRHRLAAIWCAARTDPRRCGQGAPGSARAPAPAGD